MALPIQIDPRKLAAQGTELDGFYHADQLQRLNSAVVAVRSPLKVVARFGVDEAGHKVVSGESEVDVDVVCQRCLDPMPLHLNPQFEVEVVWSEDQAERVARQREAWIVGDRYADFRDLLEDEILLALPLVSYHDAGKCTGDALYENEEPPVEDGAVPDSPFNVLQQLKK